MQSIRTRIITLMLIAIITNVFLLGAIGIYAIVKESNEMSTQNLSLVCENRKDSIDEYLNSIQQSVNMISRYAVDSLDSIALMEGGVLGATGSGVEEIPGRTDEQRRELDQYFDEHLALIESAFKSVANHTNGVASGYYRINPEITASDKGFFFQRGNFDFQKVELTDLTAYDTEDTEHVGRYFQPLKQGRSTWLDPYFSVKMNDYVISYAVPLYKAGTFIGIIGMDIRYETLVTLIQQFSSFKTGFFALADETGTIYYHPELAAGTRLSEVSPQLNKIVKDLRRDSSAQQLIRYNRNGIRWQMTYSTLTNKMKLAAVVKVSEINATATNLTETLMIAYSVITLIFFVFAAVSMKRVTEPLEKLTIAARKLTEGDYSVELNWDSDDEVGILTSTFRSMRDRLQMDITELSKKAFRDDLTNVKSKHAFVEAEADLDQRIESMNFPSFAMALFDLNDLKLINDSQGHEMGDQYIKEACRIICSIFKHSPVYRVGGDEFVAILEGQDYENRAELFTAFEELMDANLMQDKVTVASGYSCFDPQQDKSAHSVLERADENMFLRKKSMKKMRR